ncbi:DNA-binding response regulator, OmpR family, contains REC and winged-helix (wHTH) domain [Natronincola peptidivorans]|uniref:Heme response regulator HssR n=1 Tax=Natronincola peptidivorans TaxID=426128 RepID=A0A1I0HEH2_9FIRM|nr:response regulator transcription factor [Natronincola peptidivorans]SET82109.1 DNA-binding response regulator, OmpR family, contains REC and winged-helix (wHTH) domain [Natronincola peptidivorans]
MVNILVAEDDKNLQKLMTAVLKQQGYHVLNVKDGIEALEILDTSHVDLIISDIMMPNMDGYDLTDVLRKSNYNLPILMVTAKETLEDKRKGFLVGTDDYMVKPIDMDEMILRVAALLRRSRIINDQRLVIGEVELDYNALTVNKNQHAILLPKKEFYLLFKLLSYPKHIFTRQQLMDEIWGMESEADERTVDVHIKRLREKFADFNEFEIVTVRGLGYKIV